MSRNIKNIKHVKSDGIYKLSKFSKKIDILNDVNNKIKTLIVDYHLEYINKFNSSSLKSIEIPCGNGKKKQLHVTYSIPYEQTLENIYKQDDRFFFTLCERNIKYIYKVSDVGSVIDSDDIFINDENYIDYSKLNIIDKDVCDITFHINNDKSVLDISDILCRNIYIEDSTIDSVILPKDNSCETYKIVFKGNNNINEIYAMYDEVNTLEKTSFNMYFNDEGSVKHIEKIKDFYIVNYIDKGINKILVYKDKKYIETPVHDSSVIENTKYDDDLLLINLNNKVGYEKIFVYKYLDMTSRIKYYNTKELENDKILTPPSHYSYLDIDLHNEDSELPNSQIINLYNMKKLKEANIKTFSNHKILILPKEVEKRIIYDITLSGSDIKTVIINKANINNESILEKVHFYKGYYIMFYEHNYKVITPNGVIYSLVYNNLKLNINELYQYLNNRKIRNIIYSKLSSYAFAIIHRNYDLQESEIVQKIFNTDLNKKIIEKYFTNDKEYMNKYPTIMGEHLNKYINKHMQDINQNINKELDKIDKDINKELNRVDKNIRDITKSLNKILKNNYNSKGGINYE